ncbi:MAG: SLC13 family permease [Phycisphaerae bacterium]
MKAILVVGAAVIAAVLVWVLVPEEAGNLPRKAGVIFVVAAILWGTELIPLFATSLGVVVACALLLAEEGGLATTGGITSARFFTQFGSNVIMLFLGGLVISAAATKHGLDKAIASRVLQPFIGRPLALIYAVLAITAFFSMWMSNTATAAMMLAILAPILTQMQSWARFSTGLALAVPMGANIGGIGTPVGTPPNAIALAALRTAGFEVSFLNWMVMAVPLAVVLLLIVGGIIYLAYRPKGPTPANIPLAKEPLSVRGWGTLVVLVLAIVAWLTTGFHGVPDGLIGLTAAAVLAVSGLIDRNDLRGIEWPVLVLMWGGLALGVGAQDSGLVGLMNDLPLAALQGFLLAGLVVAVSLVVSTFISNTATAALLVPIVLAFSLPERGQLVVLAALACSFAMAMPVSTPPNALAFATGRISAQDLLKVGGLMSLIAIAVVMAGYPIMLPLAQIRE